MLVYRLFSGTLSPPHLQPEAWDKVRNRLPDSHAHKMASPESGRQDTGTHTAGKPLSPPIPQPTIANSEPPEVEKVADDPVSRQLVLDFLPSARSAQLSSYQRNPSIAANSPSFSLGESRTAAVADSSPPNFSASGDVWKSSPDGVGGQLGPSLSCDYTGGLHCGAVSESDSGSPVSAASGLGRLLAGGRFPAGKSLESGDGGDTGLERGAGRGKTLLAMLGCSGASRAGEEPAADRPGDTPRSSDGTLLGRMVSRNSDRQRMSDRATFSSGMDEDFEKWVDLVRQPSPLGKQQVLTKTVADKITSPVPHGDRENLRVPYTVAGNETALELGASAVKRVTSLPDRGLLQREQAFTESPHDQAADSFPVTPAGDGRSRTPLSCDSPGPLNSSSDISVSGEGSRKLTKRPPRVAARLGSSSNTPFDLRSTTPVPLSAEKSLPAQPSSNPSSGRSTPACVASLPPSGRSGDSYGCIPEISRKTVADHAAFPTDSR